MKQDLMDEWSVERLSFICRKCAFLTEGTYVFIAALIRLQEGVGTFLTEGTYDFIAALIRLQEGVGTSHLQDVISTERLLLRTYNIKLDHPSGSRLPGLTDSISLEIIRKFQPILLNDYFPLKVDDDGNCFYRVMSRALYNTEQHHLHFRLLIALEMAEYPQFYDNTHKDYINIIGEAVMLCESYSNELVAACTPRQWAGLIHLYATSGALQIAFRSYCPPVLHDLFFFNSSV